jgi:uncharacterized membrane protein
VGAVTFFVRLSTVVWIVLVPIAVLCIWQASRGGRWKLPIAGGFAEKLTADS